MSVISKDLAGQIATKLTEKSRIAVEKLRVEYQELATSIYEEQTPDDVKKCFKNNSDWFYTTTSLVLKDHGFKYERMKATRTLIANNTSDAYIKMTAAIGSKLFNAKVKWEKAEEKYKTLKTETKQALLTLKTFANIRKELPEAIPMLPPPMSNALVCNFDSLKKQLAKQPEVKATVPQ